MNIDWGLFGLLMVVALMVLALIPWGTSAEITRENAADDLRRKYEADVAYLSDNELMNFYDAYTESEHFDEEDDNFLAYLEAEAFELRSFRDR